MVIKSSAKPGANAVSSIPKGTAPGVRDDDGGEEAYYVADESKESCSQDIDDFERRLKGERVAPRVNNAKGGNPPARGIKMSAPPMVPAKAYNKVKATGLTEEEEEKADDLRAVSELERFEARLPK
mmetsp:Transcript_41732/g.104297  ORF Transcript_41732/g.104297 Transcript_41732/m.104297 type:complete len:126 (+) Transcript_41732:41-418(+)